jgi:hypothetical protein
MRGGALGFDTRTGNPVPPRTLSVGGRKTIDLVLQAGQAPRPVVRRYAGLNRKALTRPRDGCLAETYVTKAGMLSERSTRTRRKA